LGQGLLCNWVIHLLPFRQRGDKPKRTQTKRRHWNGALGTVGNIVWFVFAGLWLAIGHVFSALACFITIIGIPFGIQHLKLAGIAIAPIGKTVVSMEVAAAARKSNAEATVAALRAGT
jgi:uncharacterized membrane protein YccF (DUF307 family)